MPAITPHTPIDQHMRDWRHDLHRHPETAYEETRTAAKIAALLHDLGKAKTPPDILPKHHGHDLAGVERAGLHQFHS